MPRWMTFFLLSSVVLLLRRATASGAQRERTTASGEQRERCTLKIEVGSLIDVKCEGREMIHHSAEWPFWLPDWPIEIGPGIQLFGKPYGDGLRSFFLVEDRELELFNLNLTQDSFFGTWNIASPITVINSTVWITNSTFRTSCVTSKAGGVYVANSSVFVHNCSFIGQLRARYPSEAGAIRMTNGSTLFLSESEFSLLKSEVAAVYADCNSTVQISRTFFRKNHGNMGGAVFIKDGGSVDISESTFRSCHSAESDGPEMEVDRCSFKQNTGGNGAAVHVAFLSSIESTDPYNISEHTAEIRLSNSVLEVNVANQDGGAIYVEGVSLYMKSTVFAGNQAEDHGAGLCIRKAHNVLIDGCSFELQDFAKITELWYEQYGGGIFAEDVFHLQMVSSRLIDNKATVSGGGAYFSSLIQLDIRDCEIQRNKAQNQAGIAAKRVQVLDIDNVTVSKNEASAFGGGMGFIENSNLLMKDVSFAQNIAAEKGALALASVGFIQIEDCSFKQNRAQYAGSAALSIEASLESNISRTEFHQNVAAGEGAGILAENVDSFGLWDCHFIGNSAYNGGASVIRVAKRAQISSSHFELNEAVDGMGGSLFVDAVDLFTIRRSTFKHNRATNGGGAVAVADIPYVSFTHTKFSSNNSTRGSGGALAALKIDNIYLRVCKFHNNQAFQDGGAASLESVYNKIDIIDSEFHGNAATGRKWSDGGALAMFLFSTVTLEQSKFRGNRASRNGGAISLPHTNRGLVRSIDMTGTAFTENEARDGSGGALYFEMCGSNAWSYPLSERLRVVENLACLTVDRCRFESNTASLKGGAVLVHNGEHVSVSGGTRFLKNKLTTSLETLADIERIRLGHPHRSEITALMSQGTVEETVTMKRHPNREKHGGALALIGIEQVNLTDSLLVENEAPGFGGGAFIQDSREIASQDNRFVSNLAGTSGGGLLIDGAWQVTQHRSAFENNRVRRGEESNRNYGEGDEENGGGLVVRESHNMQLENENYTGNQATASGGAASFERNSARKGGAVQIAKSNAGVMDRCRFEENRAAMETSRALPGINLDDMKIVEEVQGADEGHGGAVAIEDCSSLSLDSSDFRSNVAHGHGGAFFCHSCDRLDLSHVSFLRNGAHLTGGAISLASGNLSLSAGEFTGNHALEGGVLAVNGSYVKGTGLQTLQNKADDRGGLVFCLEPSVVFISLSDFTDDGSLQGSSFMAACGCHLTVLASKVSCSDARVNGCGLTEADPHCNADVSLTRVTTNEGSSFGSIYKLIVPPLVILALLIILFKLYVHLSKKSGHVTCTCEEDSQEDAQAHVQADSMAHVQADSMAHVQADSMAHVQADSQTESSEEQNGSLCEQCYWIHDLFPFSADD